MNKKKKIICLVFIGGRVGSSLAMGLLKKSGINVGKVGKSVDANNLGGYFEISEMITEVYTNFYPQLSGPMPYPVQINDPDIHEFLTRKNITTFEKKFFSWFPGKNQQLALKVGYLHPVKLFKKIANRNGYQFIPVCLTRNADANINSIKKMQGGSRTPAQWLNWRTEWGNIRDSFNFNNRIDFNDWFTSPYKTYLKLYQIVKPPILLTEAEVLKYINPDYKHF